MINRLEEQVKKPPQSENKAQHDKDKDGNSQSTEKTSNPQSKPENSSTKPIQEAISELSNLGDTNTKKRRSKVNIIVSNLIKDHPDQFDPKSYDEKLLIFTIGFPPENEPSWNINEVLEPVNSIISILLKRNPSGLKVKENNIEPFLRGIGHKYKEIRIALLRYIYG